MTRTALAVFCSPRIQGNSARLLETVLPRFEAAGFNIERLRPDREPIRHCLGCLACERSGECIQDDVMAGMYPRLLAADVILLSSPVYFYGFPGSAKNFIDRCQALWALRYRFPERFQKRVRPGRKGYLLSVGASKGQRLFTGMWLTAKYFFDACGIEIAGRLEYRGMEEKDDFAKEPAYAERALEWAEAEIQRLSLNESDPV